MLSARVLPRLRLRCSAEGCWGLFPACCSRVRSKIHAALRKRNSRYLSELFSHDTAVAQICVNFSLDITRARRRVDRGPIRRGRACACARRLLLERERGERRARLDGPEGDALDSLPLSRQSASVFAVPSASFKVRLQQYSAGATQTSRAPRHTTLNTYTIHKTQKQRLCTSACCNRGTFCPAPADSGPASQPRPLQSRRPRPLQPLWALAPGGARSRAPAHACDELALRVQVIAQCR